MKQVTLFKLKKTLLLFEQNNKQIKQDNSFVKLQFCKHYSLTFTKHSLIAG